MTAFFAIAAVLVQFIPSLTELDTYQDWWTHVTLGGINGHFICKYCRDFALLSSLPVRHQVWNSNDFFNDSLSAAGGDLYFGIFILGEQLSIGFILGALMVFIGVWITSRA